MPQVQWVTYLTHEYPWLTWQNVLVDQRFVFGLNYASCSKSRNQSPKSWKQTFLVDHKWSNQNGYQWYCRKSVVDSWVLETEVQVSEYASNSHLPEPAKGKVKGKLLVNVNANNRKYERRYSITSKNIQNFVLIFFKCNHQYPRPKDVKLFLNS